MPQAIVDQLATAVAADLANPANAAEFNAVASFEAKRISVLEFDGGVQVTGKPTLYVFGADERRTIIDRGKRTEREWDVEIAIVSALSADANESVDPLKLLVEQVADFWEVNPIPTGAGRRWVSMEVLPYVPELVKELVFVGAVKLTFKGVKA